MSKSAKQSMNLTKEERTMTKRQLALIIRANKFDTEVLQDILEGKTIIPKGTELIIGDTHISYYSQGWTNKMQVRVAGYLVKQKSGREVFKIVDGARYFNGMLTHERVDKEFIVNPIFYKAYRYQF